MSVSLCYLYGIYIFSKEKIYNKLSISIAAAVLKRLKFSCLTNRKNWCMYEKREKSFRMAEKSNK